MDRVYTRWKSGVAAILQIAGFRPSYHGLGRHDVRVKIAGEYLLRGGNVTQITAVRSRSLQDRVLSLGCRAIASVWNCAERHY